MIPKVLHLYWDQGWNDRSLPDYAGMNLAAWEKLNPGWEVKRWSAEEVLPKIRHYWEVPEETLRSLSPVKRADLCRVWLLWRFGGAYMDLDLVPHRPLDGFLSDHIVRWPRAVKVGDLSKPPTEPMDLSGVDLILCREYRRLDEHGYPVANGAVLSAAGLDFWRDFALDRIRHPKVATLSFMGPYALTYHLRERWDQLRERTKILPPYYFLYEPSSFSRVQEKRPPWVVASHESGAEWGDRKQRLWFLR